MKKMKMALMLAAAFAINAAGNADAQDIVLLDGTSSPAEAFTFGAFDGAPPVASADGIVLNVPAGAPDNFGGAGYRPDALANTPNLGDATAILVTARLDDAASGDFVVALREDFADSGTVDEGEFFSFSIPASAFTTTGFTTLSFDPTDPDFLVFTGTGNGVGGTNNGVLDANLFEVGLQTPFGGNTPLGVTLESVSIATAAAQVPEPGSLALLIAACPLLAARRRRTL